MKKASPPSFWTLATSASVVRRALAFGIVVGSIQIAINHGDALLRGEIDGTRILKMILTSSVPYVVSTLSSVAVLRRQGRERAQSS